MALVNAISSVERRTVEDVVLILVFPSITFTTSDVVGLRVGDGLVHIIANSRMVLASVQE